MWIDPCATPNVGLDPREPPLSVRLRHEGIGAAVTFALVPIAGLVAAGGPLSDAPEVTTTAWHSGQYRTRVRGPGVTSPKSRSSGCRAGHAGYESFPLVLPAHTEHRNEPGDIEERPVTKEKDMRAQPQLVAAGPDWNQVEMTYVRRIYLDQKQRGSSALIEGPSGVPKHWGKDECSSPSDQRGVDNLIQRVTPHHCPSVTSSGRSLAMGKYRPLVCRHRLIHGRVTLHDAVAKRLWR
jgi:hypothetical protein